MFAAILRLPAGLILEIHVGERLPVAVADNETLLVQLPCRSHRRTTVAGSGEVRTCVPDMASAMPLRWWAEEGSRTQLRPDTYLEWSNSEINTTGRNDVPAEPVRIEVRRWLRSGGLRDGG
jgi:hypothetical protein